MSSFWQRLLSIIILAPVILVILWIGGIVLQVFVAFVMLVAFYEFARMAWLEKSLGLRYGLTLIAALYCGAACIAILSLPLSTLIILILAVWSSDIGGYVIGKSFGGPELCPSISPNKTISGLIGACLFPAFVLSFPLYPELGQAVLAGCMVGLIGQAGDISISYIKRRVGVKDTGNLIPGHGGILDRIDALMLVAIAYWILTVI